MNLLASLKCYLWRLRPFRTFHGQTGNRSKNASTYSLAAGIGDIRLFLLDPILGIHLPILVVSWQGSESACIDTSL